MATFPTGIFVPRTTANLPGVPYDPTQTKEVYAEDYSLPAAEIVEIETILGTNPQGAYATVKAWLTALAGAIKWVVSGSDIYFINGNVGIGTTNPLSPLSVSGQVVIGNPYKGDASLQINQTYGGWGRLTQLSTPSGAALNIINGDGQWWSWGVDASGNWNLNPSADFG